MLPIEPQSSNEVNYLYIILIIYNYIHTDDVTVGDFQLDTVITRSHLPLLAGCFDHYNQYVELLGLSAAEQADVTRTEFLERSAQSGMREALRLWRQRNPSAATFRALLDIVHSLGKSQVAQNIIKFMDKNLMNIN